MVLAKYSINQVVLAKDKKLLYDAKILELRQKNDGHANFEYKIHYVGWNKSWDCWKHENELIEKNEESLKQQEALHKKVKDRKKHGVKRKKTTSSQKRKKQKLDEEVQSALKFDLPVIFKVILVQDNEQINNFKKLHPLPEKPNFTVKRVLNDFKESGEYNDRLKKHIPEMIDGMQAFFDQALTRNLLYPFERKRYKTYFSGTGKRPHEVCSIIFLIRFFYQIPQLLAYSMNEVDRDKIEVIKQTCNAILRYLQHRSEEYFLKLIPESSKFHPDYVESGSMIWDSIASPESKPRSPKLEEEIKEELKLPDPMEIIEEEEEIKVEDVVSENVKVELPVMKEVKEPEMAATVEVKEAQLSSVSVLKELDTPPVEDRKETVSQKTSELSEPKPELIAPSEFEVESKQEKIITKESMKDVEEEKLEPETPKTVEDLHSSKIVQPTEKLVEPKEPPKLAEFMDEIVQPQEPPKLAKLTDEKVQPQEAPKLAKSKNESFQPKEPRHVAPPMDKIFQPKEAPANLADSFEDDECPSNDIFEDEEIAANAPLLPSLVSIPENE